MSRPKPEEIQAHITFRAPVSIKQALSDLAHKHKMTVSEYVRLVLDNHMKDKCNGSSADL